MKEKILISIGVTLLIIICVGTIKYIEKKIALEIMEEATKKIKKVINPIKIEKRKQWKSEKVWVKGRSLKECMRHNKELNNNTVKCRNGYYKEIRIFK